MLYRNQATFVLGYAGVAQAPNASGVYAIFSSKRWVYVGESDDIRQSLYRHLNEPTPCMNSFGPLSFSFELEGRARRTAVWQSLVTGLKAECNQVPYPVPSHAEGRHRSWLGRLWSVVWSGLRHSRPRTDQWESVNGAGDDTRVGCLVGDGRRETKDILEMTHS